MAGSQVQADVLVVGAGAAGLAAAAELARAGTSVLLVEARDRVGGRCLTRRLPGVPVPVELGAEFIHGRPEATMGLLKQAGIPAIDSTRTQLVAFGGRLQAVNMFTQAQRVARHPVKGRDVSFRAHLARQRLPQLTRTLATMMVQGFDAADPRRISAREVIDEWNGAGLGASQPRPYGGYGTMLEWLAHTVPSIQLETVVKRLRWSRSSVHVEGSFRGEPWRAWAPRAIVTVPIGVLPGLVPEKRAAIAKLASGPVIRVAMAFRSAFWEKAHPGVAFFHAPEAPFPTFWTPLPMHAPLLTAWAGGPKAEKLTGKRPEVLLRRALASVRSVLQLEEEPTAYLLHDWQADAYARGGYSYVKVGGTGAREKLAEPLEDTLFFAGEATDTEQSGTVGGALASGMRAAKEVLRCLVIAAFCFTLADPALAQVQPPEGARDIGAPRRPGLDVQMPEIPVPQFEGRVRIERFRIAGLVHGDRAALDSLLAGWSGRELSAADLAEISRLATVQLRSRGLFLAVAFFPQQSFGQQEAELRVVEGQLGAVRLDMEPGARLRRSVAAQTLAPLQPGAFIARGTFDTPLLILNDLPGVEVSPLLTRGTVPGTADLAVQVTDQPLVAGYVQFDNHHYASEFGKYQLSGQLRVRNPLGIGDLAAAELLRSDGGDRKFGLLAYSAPVNHAGTRVGVVHRDQDSRLGGEFAPLQFKGQWQRTDLELAHPWRRTNDRNLQGSLALSAVEYDERIEALGIRNHTRQRFATAALAGDWLDRLFGRARNALYAELQYGRVDKETPEAAQADALFLRQAGDFSRGRLRADRLQFLSARTSILISGIAQVASKNLDAGREIQLSGIEGVRAYPADELVADAGELATIELRYLLTLGDRLRMPLAAFCDAARGKVHKHPLPGTVDNARTISGCGLAAGAALPRYFEAVLALAWRTDEAPVADPDRRPRAWFVVRQHF